MIPNRKKYVDEHTEIRRRKWREYGANNRVINVGKQNNYFKYHMYIKHKKVKSR